MFEIWTYNIVKAYRPKRDSISVQLGMKLKPFEIIAIRRKGRKAVNIDEALKDDVIKWPISQLEERDYFTTKIKAIDSEIKWLRHYIKDTESELAHLDLCNPEYQEEFETLDLMKRCLPKAVSKKKAASKR